MRIGIYPGTFDPVHEGHIAFALKAKAICQLDQVVFLPETNPRGKTGVTTLSERIEQLRAALSDYPFFSIEEITVSPFTVQTTLPQLRSLHPSADLTLLVGSDVYQHINDWPGAAELIRSVDLAVGIRNDATVTLTTPEHSTSIIDLPETDHISSRQLK